MFVAPAAHGGREHSTSELVAEAAKAAKLHAYDLLNCPVSWDATRLDGSSRGIQHTIFGRDHDKWRAWYR
jgi:hypothetical protein